MFFMDINKVYRKSDKSDKKLIFRVTHVLPPNRTQY
jgi:hypothetical protein